MSARGGLSQTKLPRTSRNYEHKRTGAGMETAPVGHASAAGPATMIPLPDYPMAHYADGRY